MPKMFLFWKPEAPIPAAERVPVTLLSGFLGSGKTTLLNHLLSSGAEEELAVLVNDLGEVNIDASLIKRSVRTMKQPISGMVELTSGCICCSIQTELMDALLHLYRKRKPSHILIEATGVAEPKSILETLYAANLEGVRGVDFLRVANLVTVVDAANLEDHLGTRAEAGQRRRKHLLPADQRRPLEELLMEQIECADLLLLNKTDQIEPDHVDRLEGYLRGLNERAVILRCSFGQIDAAELLGTERFDEEATMASARWRTLILSNEGRVTEVATESAAPTPGFSSLTPVPSASSATGGGSGFSLQAETAKKSHHHKDYGLDSFVFNSRRPFDEAKLFKLLRSDLPGVVRAKGFYWTQRVPKKVGLLSIAGKILRADYIGDWWAEMIAAGEANASQIPEIVRKSWHPELGDRRQELVFIGIGIDRVAITRQLHACEV
jgi:G3E family GTPase